MERCVSSTNSRFVRIARGRRAVQFPTLLETGERRRMSILTLLGYDPARTATPHDSAETETVRKIVAALDRLEPDRARHIAVFAYILSRVARADLVISEAETRAMESIVEEAGELTPEQAILVVQMAKTQAILFGGTENYIVT